MDLSKLSANEKLLLYGAAAAAIGGIVGGISSVIWISVLAGLAMLVVLFLPQLSPQTNLPGSRGSLLVAIGGVGAVAAALALLTVLVDIGFWLEFAAVRTIFFLIGVAGALLMGWIAWQIFQAEGGKFSLGASSGAAPPAAPPASTTDAAPPPAAAAAPPPPHAAEAPQAASEPIAPDEPPRAYEPPTSSAERDPEDRSTP
ncbi:MAG TPA: hypothetical protein VEW95_09975 [Candidatus Limnocylindrales bacterium]|nr:hypothetical protein [Candidatus Limnocylindrales bacterium]